MTAARRSIASRSTAASVAAAGETILEAARSARASRSRTCATSPGYRPDGNCRACMVEIEGERVLAPPAAASATPGMKVAATASAREGAEAGARAAAPTCPSRVTRATTSWPLGEPGWASARPRFPRASSRRPTCRTRRSRSTSTPASSARAACAPAARCRSTTSSAGPRRPRRRSCSTSTTRWARPPASPAASACRPARPAR
jgi:ferredoxin